jgi:hypothetical protein
VREPIVVRFAAVALAAAMSDCGWTDYHEPKSGRRGLRPCDVMLFAADMTKLERFGSEQGFLSGAVVDFVYALEERYLMSDFRRGHVIAERGLVRIQGSTMAGEARCSAWQARAAARAR